MTFARDALLALAVKYGWRFEAWAVLANHYHFVGHSPASSDCARSLGILLKHLHANLSRYVNGLDNTEGRKVWHNYRETHLAFQRSYLARLNYTHNNAVHHGLVQRASDYEWCSAQSFENACSPAWVKTVNSFPFSEISRDDGDDCVGDLGVR